MQKTFFSETPDLLVVADVGISEWICVAVTPCAQVHAQAHDGGIENQIAIHVCATRSLRCSSSGNTFLAKKSSSGA